MRSSMLLMVLLQACGSTESPTPWQGASDDAVRCDPTSEVVGDGVDQDCDGADLCPLDADGDGYGGALTVAVSLIDRCGQAPHTALDSTDCDDRLASAHEVTEWFADQDGDGFGTPALTASACDPGAGWSDRDDDCDDARDDVWPGASEAPADGVDASCDGLDACYADADGDGLGDPEVLVADSLDCAHAAAAPDDCDDTTPLLPRVWFADVDADGHGDLAAPSWACDAPAGFVLIADDCDDATATTWPGAPELPYDGVDDDCDGADLTDVDHDGFASDLAGGADCDDAHADVHPGVVERCGDGVDQDCDPTPRTCGLGGDRSVDDADVMWLGDRADGLFGFAIAGGVDLTDDGAPDVVIGSPGRKLGGANTLAGAVMIASGPDMRVTSRPASDLYGVLFGAAAESAGLDLAVSAPAPSLPAGVVIGAPGRTKSQDLIGGLYAVPAPLDPGSDDLSAVSLRADGLTKERALGVRVSVADLVADGTLVVASVEAAGTKPGSDLVISYAGAFAANPAAGSVTASAFHDSARTFRDVSIGQDAFGDGALDVAISFERAGGAREVVVIPNLPRTASLSLDGATATPHLTWTLPVGLEPELIPVALVPDVTGDGRSDLVVGAACLTPCGGDGGRVWIVPGTAGLAGGALEDVGALRAGTRLDGVDADGAFGVSVTYVGDLDGNGVGDLAIGAAQEGAGVGAAWIVYGPVPAGVFTTQDIAGAVPGAHLRGKLAGGGLGFDAAPAGDVDRDGYDDLVVSAPWAVGGHAEANAGRAYLWFGGGE
jgi:hypothetical protein